MYNFSYLSYMILSDYLLTEIQKKFLFHETNITYMLGCI